MKKISFNKNNLIFSFNNMYINENNDLIMDWKIEEEYENVNNKDGYFNEAKFDAKGKAIFFKAKYKDKKYKGVSLPEDINEEFIKIEEKLLAEKNEYVNMIVDEIITGQRLIDIAPIDSDDLYYSSRLYGLNKGVNPHDVLRRAIKKLTGKNVILPAEYLRNRIGNDTHAVKTEHQIALTTLLKEDIQKIEE